MRNMHIHQFYRNNHPAFFHLSSYAILLVIADCISYYLACLAAYYLRWLMGPIFNFPIAGKFSLPYFLSLWWMLAAFLFVIAYEQLYFKKIAFWVETKSIIKSISAAIIIIFSILTLAKMGHRVSRLTISFLWFFSLWIFPLNRFIAKRIMNTFDLGKERTLIVGAGDAGQEIIRIIKRSPYLGINVVCFFDDALSGHPNKIKYQSEAYPLYGRDCNLEEIIQKHGIKTAIIALPAISYKKLLALNNELQNLVTKVFFIRDLKGIGLLNVRLQEFFMEPLLMLDIRCNVKIPANKVLKRVFDIAVSIVLFPFFFCLGVIIALAIKCDSKGPIFYFHERVGYQKRPIRVVKFRTMYADADQRLDKLLKSNISVRKEWESAFKLKNDPRVSRVGKVLRKLTLDEMPQLFNVFKGDLSLVGPRPVVNDELRRYYKDNAVYYFMTKPGMTGLWQVSGRNETDYDTRVTLDIWYALNWSPWLDIVILFKTIIAVFHQKGAY